MLLKLLGGLILLYLGYALIAGKIYVFSKYRPFGNVYRKTRPYSYWGVMLLYLILGIFFLWAK